MSPENQDWQPLDPAGAENLPGEIESALGDGDSASACVVILVDAEIDRDWGAQASLAVAKRWAASGRRIILADACLDGPVLHEAAGVENGEGVSDMVLYGASAQRITERVETGLMLAPAGTPVTQVAEVLEHVKWDMVIRGCREAGATLVFHVSTGTPGVQAMTKRAEGVLVLASPSKDVDAILGNESGPLIAVLGPTNGDVPPVESATEEGDVASVDVLPAPPDIAVVEDDDALSVEALPGLAEEGDDTRAGEPLAEELPGLPDDGAPADESAADAPDDESAADAPDDMSAADAPGDMSAVDAPDESDAFGLTGLTGSQYESDDPLEVASDPGQAPPPSQPDEADTEASLDVESTALVDNEGETAAGVASTDAGSSDDGDFAAPDLGEGASPAEVSLEDSPADGGLGDSIAADVFGDAPPEVDVEDSPAGAGVEATPAAAGGEASPSLFSAAASPPAPGAETLTTEKGVESAEAEGKPRRGYRGLARLRRQKAQNLFIRMMLILLVTSIVVGGVFYGIAYFGLINIQGITPAGQVSSYVPPPAALPGPTPQSAIMSHVLLIDLWPGAETPLSTADALRSQLPNLLFFVTPLDLDGRRQFALYAGPAYSVEEANALKEPIAVVMSRGRTTPMSPDDLEVSEAPYAFYFGEYAGEVNAQGRIEALARDAIPAYSLEVAYPDGTTGVRVYGGAFRDEFEAERMGRMLNDAGIGEKTGWWPWARRSMVLTPRRGTLPE